MMISSLGVETDVDKVKIVNVFVERATLTCVFDVDVTLVTVTGSEGLRTSDDEADAVVNVTPDFTTPVGCDAAGTTL